MGGFRSRRIQDRGVDEIKKDEPGLSETGGVGRVRASALIRIWRSYRSVALVRANERNAALVAL
jgi:hypothetical protein